jgi:hypothetical protein
MAALSMAAYLRNNRADYGQQLYTSWIRDPNTNDIGRLHLMVQYGDWLVDKNRYAEADDLYRKLIEIKTRHRYKGYGYYWLMLRAAGRGDMATAKNHARGVIQFQSQNTDSRAGKSMVTRARLVLANLVVDGSFSTAEKKYAEADLRRLMSSIKRSK